MELISLIFLWFGVGILIGFIAEYSKKLFIILFMLAVLFIVIRTITSPTEFASSFNPWWHYIIAFPVMLFGQIMGGHFEVEYFE